MSVRAASLAVLFGAMVVVGASAAERTGTAAPPTRAPNDFPVASDVRLAGEVPNDRRQIRCAHKSGPPQAGGQCDEVLLHSIVQVALDPPPLCVLGLHDAHPRLCELVRLDLDELELIGEVGGQPCVAKTKRCLPRQRGQEVLVALIKSSLDLGATFDHADEIARVFERHHRLRIRRGGRLDPVPPDRLEEDRVATAPPGRYPHPAQIE